MGVTDFIPLVGDMIDMIGNSAQNKNNWNMMQAQNKFNAEQALFQRNWQTEERKASQKYNHNEAVNSRDWMEKMINLENEFNAPVNQVRRMQAAGINPALLQMDGSLRSASPSGSPAASAGFGSGASASSSGLIPSTNPFNGVDPMLSVLQAKKLKADIQSIEDENKRKNDLHPYDIQTAEGNLRLLGVNFEIGEKTRDKMAAEIPVIQQTAKNMREEYNGIVLRNGLTEKELNTFDSKFDALMRQFEDDHNLSIENLEAIKQSVKESLSRTRLNNANAESVAAHNFLTSLEIRVKRKHEKAIMGMMWQNELAQYELYAEQLRTDKRLARLRNTGKFLPWDIPLVNDATQIQLDFLRILSECIGLSAGANISNSTSTSTSRSTLHSTSSNVSDVFTHKVD